MLTLLFKGVPTKFFKFFWLQIFLICHRCQRHRWSTLSCEYLREFSKKFETALIGHSGAGGKLIHEKNQEQKISWHCPFKYSPVHGAWQRFSVIQSLVLCYEVHLGSTENINKRSPCAPSSYYVCQTETLYSARVNGLLSKFFLYFTDIWRVH